MPIYEYECGECGHRLEALQKISEPALKDCPECHQPTLEKLISPAAFHLKGTGWYVTDFRDKGKGKDKDKKPEAEAKSGEGDQGEKAAKGNGSDKGASDKAASGKGSSEKGSSEKGSSSKGGDSAKSDSGSKSASAR